MCFAVFFIEAITPNPFKRHLHPRKALMNIIQSGRSLFDDDVLLTFIKSSSMLPIGSWYLLNTGHIGFVFKELFGVNNDLTLTSEILRHEIYS